MATNTLLYGTFQNPSINQARGLLLDGCCAEEIDKVNKDLVGFTNEKDIALIFRRNLVRMFFRKGNILSLSAEQENLLASLLSETK